MDSGSFKALELLLIVGVVGWLYVTQMRNLRRLKEEREAKQREEGAAEARQGADADEPKS
jgi:hypothetical protein